MERTSQFTDSGRSSVVKMTSTLNLTFPLKVLKGFFEGLENFNNIIVKYERAVN